MPYFYAQINPDGICYSVTNPYGPIIQADMISIDSCDDSLLGKRWTGSTWEDVLPPEPPVG
jgi:hypothetical protein